MGPMHDTLLPKHLPQLRREPERASPMLIEAAAGDAAKTFKLLKTSAEGQSEPEAQRRLNEHGPNAVAQGDAMSASSWWSKPARRDVVLLSSVDAGGQDQAPPQGLGSNSLTARVLPQEAFANEPE